MEKLWGVWQLEQKIGKGNFGTVYKASKVELGKMYYSAIKYISLPHDQEELDNLKREFNIITQDEIKAHYDDTIQSLVQEIDIMYKLRAKKNIVNYQDHLILEKKGALGYDIFIRMELLEPLDSFILGHPISEDEVVNLGIDICSALEACLELGYLHRDIKPANVFKDLNGNYKLGDFGLAKKFEISTYNMSKKGTFNYMSPEIYNGQAATPSTDIYSLGILMYKLLNNNRPPFIDKNIEVVKDSDIEKSLVRRMSGEKFPYIENVNEKLQSIIHKATSFDVDNRFTNPENMKNELIKYKNREGYYSNLYEKTLSIYDEKDIDLLNRLDKEINEIVNDNTVVNIPDLDKVNYVKMKPSTQSDVSVNNNLNHNVQVNNMPKFVSPTVTSTPRVDVVPNIFESPSIVPVAKRPNQDQSFMPSMMDLPVVETVNNNIQN